MVLTKGFPSLPRIKRLHPIAGVLKAARAWGCSKEPETNPPPISVPPQYSMIGLYLALPISQRYSSTLDASPVEPKQLPMSHEQSKLFSNLGEDWNATIIESHLHYTKKCYYILATIVLQLSKRSKLLWYYAVNGPSNTLQTFTYRMADQSYASVELVAFHVLTILGITPSIVTSAS